MRLESIEMLNFEIRLLKSTIERQDIKKESQQGNTGFYRKKEKLEDKLTQKSESDSHAQARAQTFISQQYQKRKQQQGIRLCCLSGHQSEYHVFFSFHFSFSICSFLLLSF